MNDEAVVVGHAYANNEILTHNNSIATWTGVSIHAVGRSKDPVRLNQWSSTDVAAVDSERNLPRPGVRWSIFTIHDPACKLSISTTWEIRKKI